jgi:Hypervirulence associated proteins TUDOR domain
MEAPVIEAFVLGSEPVMKKFKKGDKVTWQSHGATAAGKVKKKITSDTEAAGRLVRASKDEPQYLVKSKKSGGEAVHKPSALKRAKKK